MLGSFQFSDSGMIADRSKNGCSRNVRILNDEAFRLQVN